MALFHFHKSVPSTMFHRKLEIVTFIFLCAVLQGLGWLGTHLRIVGLQFLNWLGTHLRIVGIQFLHFLGAIVMIMGSNCKQLIISLLAALIEEDVLLCPKIKVLFGQATSWRLGGPRGRSINQTSGEDDDSSSETEVLTKRLSNGTSATKGETDSEDESEFKEEDGECQSAGNSTERVDSWSKASLETEVRYCMPCWPR